MYWDLLQMFLIFKYNFWNQSAVRVNRWYVFLSALSQELTFPKPDHPEFWCQIISVQNPIPSSPHVFHIAVKNHNRIDKKNYWSNKSKTWHKEHFSDKNFRDNATMWRRKSYCNDSTQSNTVPSLRQFRVLGRSCQKIFCQVLDFLPDFCSIWS